MAHLYPRLATRCVPRRFTIVKHNCCQPKGPRSETCLGSQISPTSSSSALSVDSPRPRFVGNGQYRGKWALLKRTAVAAKRADWAPWCPAVASLSHSPHWLALLVNSDGGANANSGCLGGGGCVPSPAGRGIGPSTEFAVKEKLTTPLAMVPMRRTGLMLDSRWSP